MAVSHSASVSSLSKPASVPSQRGLATNSRLVVTSPPWARDEPPSPIDEPYSPSASQFLDPRASTSKPRLPTDAQSTISTAHSFGQAGPESSWWTFARRTKDIPPPLRLPSRANWPTMPTPSSAKRRMTDLRERSKTWLSQRPPSSGDPDRDDEDIVVVPATEGLPNSSSHDRRAGWDMHMSLPTPAPITLANTRTPGWDIPWTPRIPPAPLRQSRSGSILNQNLTDPEAYGAQRKEEIDPFAGKSKWYIRKKRLRVFLLTNNYVPLLFRVVNIAFTSAALAVAIRIRLVEKEHGVQGAVGSSPTLVVIFAPLTLVHVVAAIYLEYFGRPLGLWRTSMKLAHTLFEVLFICAWSAALSLTFDNFFTAIIGCASPSSISWYNQIPRPVTNIPDLGRGEDGPADVICDDQIALICLVGVGLAMYCFNLVISLYRIFEKVKYHQPASHW